MSQLLHRTVCLIPFATFLLAASCFGEDQNKDKGNEVAKVVWTELRKANELPESATIENDEVYGEVVKITRTPKVPQLVELAKIENPPVKLRAYLLRGKVKFEGVQGEGFLEIWNHFPEPKKGAYFSRTMAETGPMGKLRGDSPWKEFVLPFNFDDPNFPMPEKIQFNVFLPASGAVWLTDLELIEISPKDLFSQISGAGTLPFVFWIFLTAILVLAAAIALGIVGVYWRQTKSKQVQGMELRRMQAMDLG
jgi:hypothetical protein